MYESHGGNIYRYSYPVIDFSANINPLGMPPLVKEAIRRGIDNLVHYPDPDYIALRSSLGTYCGVSPDNIVVGNGATELIFQLFRSLGPRRVLAVVPLFTEYERAARLVGADFLHFTLRWEDSFSLPLSELLGRMRKPGLDMLVLCNPNNPTGQLLGAEAITPILEMAAKNGVIVVVDETFIEFTDGYPLSSALVYGSGFSNLIVLRALTKFYALPGLRLGYAWIGDTRVMERFRLAQEPWSVNSLAAAAGEVAFIDQDYITATRAWLKEERPYVYETLRGFADLTVFPPSANFVLGRIKRVDLDAAKLKELLLTDGILIRDASNFAGLDRNFIRLAIKAGRDNRYLLDRLSRYLN